MANIEIRYDPDNGFVFPDNKVEGVVDKFIENSKRLEGTCQLVVGSELTIDYFRLAVKQGKIDCNDIVILFKEEVLLINKNGRLPRWPKGFCDHLTDVLSKL